MFQLKSIFTRFVQKIFLSFNFLLVFSFKAFLNEIEGVFFPVIAFEKHKSIVTPVIIRSTRVLWLISRCYLHADETTRGCKTHKIDY